MNISLEYIKRLATGAEGVDVEFKETTGQLNRGMETLCGMINGNGGLVEYWRRGLSLMARECEHVGIPAPYFHADDNLVNSTFTRPKSIVAAQQRHSKDTAGHSNTSLEKLIIRPAAIRLIGCIGEDWLTANALCDLISLYSKSLFIRNHLKPAIEEGLVTLENPDKRNASNQKYGLTVKDKAAYYEQRSAAKSAASDTVNGTVNSLSPFARKVFEIIKKQPDISYAEIETLSGKSRRSIARSSKSFATTIS